ncbi:helix-turn-helix domain-containing protein [Seonamhaeicola marinus]|uniref:Helix-turn-helix domain-containing protein n=1 Tax=Seonamhaeicola marinus TaxID=1912246 RepID=A0A5D0J140_9FLAO|nr:helix-turn-helix domain-containing protein [Seonamhaeicola marinus]TYA89191.1 helix-turn-helix domain-containing protein [Seonamhaeicola marinus]
MRQINQMLLEMASGNFFYRLERTSKNDNVEALIITLNMLAEEIQESLLHQGYVNTNETFSQVVQMTFLLDEHGHIIMTNKEVCNILSMLCADIINKPFESLLVKESQTKWKQCWKSLVQKSLHDTSLELTFKTKSSLVIPKVCYITTCKNKKDEQGKVIVTVIHQSTDQAEIEKKLKDRIFKAANTEPLLDTKETTSKTPKIRLSHDDIRKIRKGHDIIINNLDKELPSLRDFALQLGTNEFKLKYGFKELYGTTVYRFLLLERLRKSKMMIQYTDLQLKSIAHMVGFKSFPHFSRAFKKHYEYTPSELRKKALNEEI